MKASQKTESTVVIEELKVGKATVWIKGITPYIYNTMSEKSKHDLLFPKGRKTTAEKEQNLKHNPIEEYRGSVYRFSNGIRSLSIPAAQFKAAMMNAALEIPGAKKSQVGKLVWVDSSDMLQMYGIPKLKMDVVRSADIGRTPDVRTRAILPQWCCKIELNYVKPTINETTLSRLVQIAGLIIGVGDYRQEKGKGNFGQFEISTEEACKEIVASGNPQAQVAALDNPTCYDVESEKLYAWYQDERKKRGK